MCGGGGELNGMNTFPRPSIPLQSSTNRSQRAFVSAPLLPFFPSPLERANTFSFCQHSPPLPVCAYVCVCAQTPYMCGLGHVLLVASGPVCPYLNSPALLCGCRMAGYLNSCSIKGWAALFILTRSSFAWHTLSSLRFPWIARGKFRWVCLVSPEHVGMICCLHSFNFGSNVKEWQRLER